MSCESSASASASSPGNATPTSTDCVGGNALVERSPGGGVDVAVRAAAATSLECGSSASHPHGSKRGWVEEGTAADLGGRGRGLDGLCRRRCGTRVGDEPAVFSATAEADGGRDKGEGGHGLGQTVDGFGVGLCLGEGVVGIGDGGDVLEAACPAWFELGGGGLHLFVVTVVVVVVVTVVVDGDGVMIWVWV